jgi:hypothetical protein
LTETLAFKRLIDPVGYDPAVPASVEEGDPSASGSPLPESPQERVKRLFFGRRACAVNGEAARIERQDQLVDKGTLSGCAPAFKEYDRRDSQRLYSPLQLSQLQVCFRFLGFEAGFINCPRQIDILKHDCLPRALIAFDILLPRAKSILENTETIFRTMARLQDRFASSSAPRTSFYKRDRRTGKVIRFPTPFYMQAQIKKPEAARCARRSAGSLNP